MGAGFVKVAADLDSNPKIRRAGRAGREVFLFILRRTNLQERDGRCPLSNVEPWYLADQLQMPEDEASAGVERAIAARLIAIDGEHVVVCGWDDEWAKRPAEGAERTERWRNKRRAEHLAHGASPDVPVTGRDGASVTERHQTSPVTAGDVAVTECDSASVTERHSPSAVTAGDIANVNQRHGDESDASDQIRVDQIRVDHVGECAPPPLTHPGHDTCSKAGPAVKRTLVPRALRSCAMPVGWAPRADEIALARSLVLDPATEADSFRDHHGAKGSRFVDWDAAFRSWLRNAVKFGRAGSGARGGATFFEIIDSLPPPRPPEVPS